MPTKTLWLCLRPAHFDIGYPVTAEAALPEDVVAVLCVFRTRKAAITAMGKDAPLTKVTLTPKRGDD